MSDDIVDRAQAKAEAELERLDARARAEGWDLARIEAEKSRYELGAEVTLCATPGCMKLAVPIPGFREQRCAACGGGAP